ncbi:ATP-dependent RNA helicase HrpA [Spelaeicoccus albus]|uniref:ATP-dependent helicase HrpA n=1 Tax=Spelaeicoccus albus TaxID=1280376 RepID=A0A7Z0D2X9_9MICO|nr:ATP-dependent RNA helicase HrpA [Spelaeicoccus albus]NYI67892.1 ATP-dependent helicase HrpA [Spelaeicoccus albus]
MTAAPITYPPDLPISARRDDIAAAIRDNQVVIIAGETGSGKTTQLPKICLELGLDEGGLIGHTQPRRIAARTVADRIAGELGSRLGGRVGYQVRFTSQVAADTAVKVMTDGILLAGIGRDPDLKRYSAIIIDEAHERSLNIDFILGYLKRLLPRRPGLKVIITSATIDPERFSRHFFDAPIIEVSGRTYPVEIRYRPLVAESSGDDADDSDEADDDPLASRTRDQSEGIIAAVDELMREPPGDILVFLSGEREIRDTLEQLTGHLERRRGAAARPVDVIPLYARLSSGEQHRVFTDHSRPRIVLATNVAETSLTVPGIKYVIDTGTARISRYSHRTKVQRLPIERISQASANQRAGRCGRTSDGICIRLYGKADFESRPEFTDPEILRTNLAAVILQMASLGFARTDAELLSFPFVEPPDSRAVRDGRTLLTELGALRSTRDGATKLTRIGRQLSGLPIDPRLGRMLVEAQRRGVVAEVLVIVAALSIQDPRERPAETRDAADAKHRRFDNDRSDFLTLLNLWTYAEQRREELSSNQFRKLCRAEYLNFMRLREWQDLAAQLRHMARPQGITGPRMKWAQPDVEPGAEPDPQREAIAESVHRSVLTGLLTQVGMRIEPDRKSSSRRSGRPRGDFHGVRGTKFAVFPGSALFKKPPKWIMSAELVETSRLWARMNARIEPDWLLQQAGDLLKHGYSDPHWEAKRGAVMASEKVTLLGLPVVDGRRVQYGRIDPELSRDLFIRRALVEGDWKTRHRFLARNRRLVADVEELESRTRRGMLVDDETLFAFYDERIPADVVSARHFDAWWKKAGRDAPNLLDFTPDMLVDEAAADVDDADFPVSWPLPDGTEAPLTYQFEPGTEADGVTVALPIEILGQIDDAVFTWQIPGLRVELITALIRSLPKPVRRHFVPAPDVAARAAATLEPYAGDIRDALAAELSAPGEQTVRAGDFDMSKVPDHLRMTFRIVDVGGRALREDTDLAALRETVAPTAQRRLSEAASTVERRGVTEWDFGTLDDAFEREAGGHRVQGYPALVDDGDTVSVAVRPRQEDAQQATWHGVRKLVLLSVPSPAGYVREHLSNTEKLVFARQPAGVDAILDDCVVAAADRLMLEYGLTPESNVRERDGFVRLRSFVAERLVDAAFDVVKVVGEILARYGELDRQISGTKSLTLLPVLADIRAQIDALVHPGFIAETGWEQLHHVPRYVAAARIRLDKAAENPQADRSRADRVGAMTDEYEKALSALPKSAVPGPALSHVRWMIEELRVSLFAQQLGTAYPVSEQRIRKALAAAR